MRSHSLPGTPSRVLASLLTVGAASVLARAEAPPSPPPTFPAATELVHVDVVVLDKAGRPVSGLGHDDFQVREEGVPRPVVTFEAVAPASPEEAQGPIESLLRQRVSANKEAEDGSHFLFLFDTHRLRLDGARRAASQLRQFLTTKAGATDRITLATTASSSTWTGRPEDLRGSLTQSNAATRGASHMARLLALDPAVLAHSESVEASNPGLGGALAPRDPTLNRPPPARWLDATAARADVRATLTTLEGLIQSTAGVKGHKALVFVSEGFGSLYPGTPPELRGALAAAEREHVTVYFLSACGLKVPRPESRDPCAQAAVGDGTLGAQELASATGGFTVHNTEDLLGGLDRIAQQNRTYYVLGFEPGAPRDGKFHRIEVRLKSGDYEVRARPGYSAVGPEARPRAADSGPGIPLRLSALVATPVGAKRKVTLVAEADPGALGFDEQGRAALESWMEISTGGRPAGQQIHHVVKLRLTAEQRSQMADAWLPLTRELELAPGAYEAVFRIQERQSRRRGSVRHSFEVAAPRELTMSSVLTDSVDRNGRPRPIARRHFTPASTLICGIEAWSEGPARRIMGAHELRRADGTLVRSSEPVPIERAPDGRLTQGITLPLADLAPGEYLLVLTVAGSLGESVTSQEPFVIVPPPHPK